MFRMDFRRRVRCMCTGRVNKRDPLRDGVGAGAFDNDGCVCMELMHKASEERQKTMLLRYWADVQRHRSREERQKARLLVCLFQKRVSEGTTQAL